MKSQAKLKFSKEATRYLIVGLSAGIIYFFAGIIENEVFGTYYTQWVWGVLLFMFAVFVYLKFKQIPKLDRILFAIAVAIVGLGAWHYEMAKHMDTILTSKSFQIHVIIMVDYFIFMIPIIPLRLKRVATHSRQIFELAARPVENAEDGFTARPYPAGKAQYSKDEVIGFAKYLHKNLIARSQIEDDKVIIAISISGNTLAMTDLQNSSYVSFDYDGNISVLMMKSDYEQYKDKLSFDQLCESLANTFIRFLGYYQNGAGEKILASIAAVDSKFHTYVSMGLLVLLFATFVTITLFYFTKSF
jgi:hypothetical protein